MERLGGVGMWKTRAFGLVAAAILLTAGRGARTRAPNVPAVIARR